MKIFYRIILFELILITLFCCFINYTTIEEFTKKDILSTIISVSSIILAIIVTFLFSKLFAEKTIRIERKKEIDELSKKITYLRRLAFHIRGMHDFWNYQDHRLKSKMDSKYNDLLYEEYRGYDLPGLRKFTYEESTEIDKDIFGTDGQAYLALKALEDNESSFIMFNEFNPKNYSIEDIIRYKEYSNSFWYFLDRSDRTVYNFSRVNRYFLNSVDELYFKINNKLIDQNDYRKSIKELFEHFDSEVFEKHFYLNSLNSDIFPITFKHSFLNMLIFLIIVIFSLILYIININTMVEYLFTLILSSVFITNIIDLIFISFLSIKFELNIKDIYKI